MLRLPRPSITPLLGNQRCDNINMHSFVDPVTQVILSFNQEGDYSAMAGETGEKE